MIRFFQKKNIWFVIFSNFMRILIFFVRFIIFIDFLCLFRRNLTEECENHLNFIEFFLGFPGRGVGKGVGVGGQGGGWARGWDGWGGSPFLAVKIYILCLFDWKYFGYSAFGISD